MNYRKLSSNEFNKLKYLFPGTEEQWDEYEIRQIYKLDNNIIDIYVIEDNDKIIGELTINYENNYLEEETIPNVRVYLEAFRISKDYQNKGLGTKLITYALNDLESSGYTEFTIGVEDDNEVAKHIYFKYGFTESIAQGKGSELDPCEYTLYLRRK